MTMTDHAQIAKQLFFKGYNCAQAVFCAFTDITGYDIDAAARISSSFGGGLGRLRETCGVVSAAAMVLGIVYGYDDPDNYEAKKRHYELIRKFAEMFKTDNSSINCRELLTLAGLAPESGGTPEPRSEDFYQKRPCPALVYDAARILDEIICAAEAEDRRSSE